MLQLGKTDLLCILLQLLNQTFSPKYENQEKMDQYFNFLLLIFNSYYLNGYRRPLHRLVIANVTFKGNYIFLSQSPGSRGLF